MNNKTIFLNSGDTPNELQNTPFNNKIHIQVEDANIFSSKPIKLQLKQFQCSSLIGRVSTIERNLKLAYSYNGVDYQLSFNNIKNISSLGEHAPWNTQTNIQDIIRSINQPLVANILFVNDRSELYANEAQPIIFKYASSHIDVLKALGLYTKQNTSLSSTNNYAPFPFNVESFFQNIYLKSNFSVESCTSQNLGNTHILANIPVKISKGTQGDMISQVYSTTDTFDYLMSGNIIYQNQNNEHQQIISRHIDEITIELVDHDGFAIFTNGTYSVELLFNTF